MRTFIPVASACALLLAACGRPSTMDEQMKQDLDAASAATIEMAPRGSGTKVVSALEQNKAIQPRVAPVRHVSAPAKTPPPTAQQPQQVTAAEPAATLPVSAPKVQPPPPGGYKTVDEVIRNAPFPIKPAFWRP